MFCVTTVNSIFISDQDMPWGKKKSALTVKNATIMTRSCSSFFKMFSSTRIHPQQESRGGPSVNPSRHHSLRHHWFPNQKCFISVYIFFLFVCSFYRAAAGGFSSHCCLRASAVVDHGLQGPWASVFAACRL